jgi:hypothetical protein
MCTVIFFPAPEGILLSSNRDEHPLRQATPPQIVHGATGRLLYPTDTAGGTWVGVHENGHILILLNGAFVKHERQSFYRKSRGLIVRELLDTMDPLLAYRATDLTQIEPFTLILWQQAALYELVWDGQEKHITIHSPTQPRIWSSATLYDATVQDLRKGWFRAWLASDPVVTPESLSDFLCSHQEPENGFVMNRQERVKTLSISILTQQKQFTSFAYYETNGNDYRQQIATANKSAATATENTALVD